MAKRPVTGVVLCGGYSTRMGSDKGLLCAGNGPPLAAVAFEKLIQICSQVVVSIREEQRGAYNAILPKAMLVGDVPGPGGPFRGIHSAWCACSTDLLVLAADMPDITVTTLEMLKAAGEANRKVAVCFVNGRLEPLAGFYPDEAVRLLAERPDAHESLRMQDIGRYVPVHAIPHENRAREFLNLNSNAQRYP